MLLRVSLEISNGTLKRHTAAAIYHSSPIKGVLLFSHEQTEAVGQLGQAKLLVTASSVVSGVNAEIKSR